MADVLLMATKPASPREIQIRVRDGDGTLLRGTVISWTEDGEARGTIDPSDGHTTVYPLSEASIVEVVANYEGDVQTRKLAVDQTLCEFDYPNVHLNPPAMASTSVPAPLTPAESAKSPWWSTSTVLATVVTTIGVIVVGYLQFGPAARDKDKVTLTVYVKDASSAVAISRAKVTVQSASVPAPVLTDNQGVAIFELPGGRGESLTITGSAANYEDGAVVTKASDRPVELLLKPRPTPGTRPLTTSAPSGTWEIRVSGNIALRRVESGTFDFSAMPDGRTAVRAQIEIDGTEMRLSGIASRQNDRLFLTYSAQTAADSWEGQGQLQLSSGSMQGYLTDARRQQVPITLRKP